MLVSAHAFPVNQNKKMPEATQSESRLALAFKSRLTSRGDLTAYLTQLCSDLAADHYMLMAVTQDRDSNDARIIASNWVYDAIHMIGSRQLAGVALSRYTVMPGRRGESIDTSCAPDLGNTPDGASLKLMNLLGHAEIYSLRLHVGRMRYYLLVSTARHGSIDAAALPLAQLRTCYALSDAPELLSAAALSDPLTSRERECMFWVAEGKTTDDIAVILSVSANTANSYITNAMQKLGSSNRAMAMATAIRSGII